MKKQPVTWEDCCVEYCCEKTRNHRSSWTGRRDMTKQEAQEGQYRSTGIRQTFNLQTALPPGSHVFQPINMAIRNLIEGQPMNISTKWFKNRLDTFGKEYFLSFHYGHLRQNSPALSRPCFLTNHHGLKESDRGHQRNISTKLFSRFSNYFVEEDFLSFHNSHIGQNSPHPLVAMLFNQSTFLEGI